MDIGKDTIPQNIVKGYKMSEYNTWRCDHCNGPKSKGKGRRSKPIYKKIKKDKLYQLVKEYVLNIKLKKKTITAEEVAEKLQVKKHYITQIFMKLNQEGILSQAHNYPPHDCRRAMSVWDWGSDNSWKASEYSIL